MKHALRSLLSLAMLPGLAFAAPPLDDPLPGIVARTGAEAARVARVTAAATDFTAPEPFEALPGGAATVRARHNRDAFSQSSANMPFEREMQFKLGNGLFRKLWVSAPSSTRASDGLGPLFNARSCQNCHLKDGRGHPPEGPEDNAISMFLRLSVPGTEADAAVGIEDYLATRPDPVYGGQLQDLALPGVAAEGRMAIEYTEIPVALSDGERASLRAPAYRIENPAYGAPDPGLMISPRVAPPMIGLGLVEAIPAIDILALADPDDKDGNGISGRPNIVPSEEFGRPMLGRFGLKAGMPSIREQSAGAFSGDIGIANPIFPEVWGDCTGAEADCRAAPDGGDAGRHGLEIDDEGFDLVAFYSRNLAVPARRDIEDPQVLRGKEVFYTTGCADCHHPKFVTHRLQEQPEQSFQLIWPYSDFLLHDMGDGLADHRPEGRATGTEWRTAPLWGIGLTETVNGHTYFLHDGRARSLLEAVLWHDGEARAARDAVVSMPKDARAALMRFLESL